MQAAALNLGFTRVTAPLAGRVSDRKVAPGNLVTADTTVLTSVVSTDPIRFIFTGSEAAYEKYERANAAGTRPSSRVAPNPVEIRIEGAKDYAIKGRMDFVDNTVDPQSGTIRGRAVVDNPGGGLTPGLFGHLRLLGSGKYRALLVPGLDGHAGPVAARWSPWWARTASWRSASCSRPSWSTACA